MRQTTKLLIYNEDRNSVVVSLSRSEELKTIGLPACRTRQDVTCRIINDELERVLKNVVMDLYGSIQMFS